MTERKEIDTTRPCMTRDGGYTAEYVRSINGTHRVWILTNTLTGHEMVAQRPINPVNDRDENWDIINAPQTREVWLPINVTPNGTLWVQREDIEYDTKPTDNYGDRWFVGWQCVTITDQPQGED